jgi:threonine dehydrogenase-like Zn-dependent dehydrogenase
VARVLIVGCGCRGQGLARALRAEGHSVRATSRTEDRRAAIEDTGAEFHLGDPDRIGTLTHALDNATILLWLMGSATGDPEKVAALHGTRLKMLLERTIDTTVRGMVYEAAGTVPEETLAEGAATVRKACDFSEIPHREVRADPADHEAWQAAMLAAIGELLVR